MRTLNSGRPEPSRTQTRPLVSARATAARPSSWMSAAGIAGRDDDEEDAQGAVHGLGPHRRVRART